MFVANCRQCPLSSKLTGFVLNVSKSYTFCPLSQTQLEISVILDPTILIIIEKNTKLSLFQFQVFVASANCFLS
ncbi:hypothetical protein HanRHA438_Chr17g0810841 [Helianthus annuus]|uniref:Uncharacterized protein n=1 Tax=Helianthus annuus TaxID=4232 RepID=A0A9K3DH52_HELAN|nr:hypothetical protein HanXRQr2_Chr17g0800831 [Helianthus annuus]KAJ0813000.1 hypothetical protein HanPSC8_Chr17g0768471 [Helianthus annuus]KAJ0826124.1 hypothetical protein HanRHA438_Chr17g0810841 [Helianthus annuus]